MSGKESGIIPPLLLLSSHQSYPNQICYYLELNRRILRILFRYRRVAAYLVADVMEQFQKRTMYPPVKHELVSTLHHLLDILDLHASRYLLSVLPAGVRELFRVEYDQFQKFYKFKGKV